jgi:hypothetical protein
MLIEPEHSDADDGYAFDERGDGISNGRSGRKDGKCNEILTEMNAAVEKIIVPHGGIAELLRVQGRNG